MFSLFKNLTGTNEILIRKRVKIFQQIQTVQAQIADIDKQLHGSQDIRAQIDSARSQIVYLENIAILY